MKTLRILFISFVLAMTAILGCTTVGSNTSTDTIVARYTSKYIEVSSIDTNTDNHDIAAMLQTITVDLIKNPSGSWKQVTERENQYVSMITTGYISSVYTIEASSNEVKFIDGFCDEIIYYYSVIEPDYARFIGDFLGESSTRLIINMDNYEYDKFRNR